MSLKSRLSVLAEIESRSQCWYRGSKKQFLSSCPIRTTASDEALEKLSKSWEKKYPKNKEFSISLKKMARFADLKLALRIVNLNFLE